MKNTYKMTKESSYMAASVIPTKLLHNEIIKDGKIIPIHLQLIPTNACNLRCSFCSCSDSDREKELTLEQMTNVIDTATERGTKAITLTGGGEPLMHPNLNEVMRYASNKGIQMGLTTNGVALDRLEKHDNLTWTRISCADDRRPKYSTIEKALTINPDTDWAFSYVVTSKPSYDNIAEVVNFANNHKFTHVRMVSDLGDLANAPSMKQVRDTLFKRDKEFDDSKILYQGRKDSSRGSKDCYISLLKPMVAPEGIFPCCGAQYAILGQKKDMIDEMSMGSLDDLGSIIDEQRDFDGSSCDICYYSQYNDILGKMKDKPEHKEFV